MQGHKTIVTTLQGTLHYHKYYVCKLYAPQKLMVHPLYPMVLFHTLQIIRPSVPKDSWFVAGFSLYSKVCWCVARYISLIR